MKICHELWAEEGDLVVYCETDNGYCINNKFVGMEGVSENNGEETDEDEDAFGTNFNTFSV